MTWSFDSSKVAVLAGDNVHIFDAHDQGARIHVLDPRRQGRDQRADRDRLERRRDLHPGARRRRPRRSGCSRPTARRSGPIEALGAKDKSLLSTRNGSFMLLDKNRVAVSEQGFSAMTIYEIDSGKRSKLVRKLPAGPCKKDELDATWKDSAATVAPKCKEYIEKTFSHLIGADVVAGAKSLLVCCAVPGSVSSAAALDPKTLAEKEDDQDAVVRRRRQRRQGERRPTAGRPGRGDGEGRQGRPDSPAKKAAAKATDDPDSGESVSRCGSSRRTTTMRGLVPCIVQDADAGTVLMLAWMNAEALRLTRETRTVHFWSRSRQALWKKGRRPSGHIARRGRAARRLRSRRRCSSARRPPARPATPGRPAASFTATTAPMTMRSTIGARTLSGSCTGWRAIQIGSRRSSRRDATAERSYTKSLLDAGMPKILAKIAEEHGELAVELANPDAASHDKVVHETADPPLFHRHGRPRRARDPDRGRARRARAPVRHQRPRREGRART